ncbi:MAG: sigma-70 family RNA polymerase sigma factor [Myxococcaceae bacterium]|nr:sigma-70 family RNA polymerase sigma factor [Myxococcaceae bacterium]
MRTENDDSQLLEKALAKDNAAFAELVRRYRDPVYGLALRMTRSEADAAEVTQDAFLAAYRHLSEIRTDQAFGAWVHRIAANQALMKLRHRKVVANVEAPLPTPEFNERGSLVEEVADWNPTALEQSLDAELGKAISHAADELPEEYRQVFLLKDVEDLTYEQIAEITGDSVPAIKSRLHRARLAMRAAIDRFYLERE